MLFMNAFVNEFKVLKDQIGGVFWGGWGLALRGCVLTLTGEAEEAAENIASGIAAIRSTGNTMWTPLFLSYRAWAKGKIGRLDAWRRRKRGGARPRSIASPVKSH